MFNLFRLSSALVLFLVAVNSAPLRAGDLDKFLPKETDVVISLNVEQVIGSSIVKKHALDLIRTTLAGNKEAQKMMTAVGLDPLKDISRISVAVGIEDPSHPKTMIVLNGKFDARKIGDALEGMTKKQDEKMMMMMAKDNVGGRTVYRFNVPEHPAPMFTAPVDSNVLVIGSSKDYIGAAFDAAKGTRKSEIKKELSALLDKADSKSSLYAVAYIKGKFDGLPIPEPAKKAISQIDTLTLDLKVQQNVDLELNFGVDTADTATELAKLVTGGLELAKLQVKPALMQMPEMQPLLDLVNSLKSNSKEKSVIVTGKVDGEAIDKALSKDK